MEKELSPAGKLAKKIWPVVLVVAGNAMYALAVRLFLMPAGLVTGGTTGIALAVNHFFGIPVSGFVLVFNVIMLIAGYLILGRQFAATTVISTFAYPAALGMFQKLFGDLVLCYAQCFPDLVLESAWESLFAQALPREEWIFPLWR